MKSLLILAALFVSNLILAQDLVILHTNDMHSHINGLAPESEYTPLINDNDPTLGGFSRIAGFINTEKEKNGDKQLVVDCGDFLMGTLFQTLEKEEGFQMNLMKRMGYEFIALGNHELDNGTNELAKIISINQKLGGIPQILCANYVKAKDGSDSDLIRKFDDGSILPYKIIEKNGYKIGIFSVLGEDADEAMPGYVNATFEKAQKVAVKTASFLKQKEKVDLVVVLSHCGVQKNKKGEWRGEDVEMGKASKDIDIILGGHTHTFMPEIVKVENAIVVQTGSNGSNVGKVEVTFDQNRKPIVKYHLIPMNDQIVADASVQKLIDEKAVSVEKNILSRFGVKLYEPLFETGFKLEMDDKKPESSNLGPFVSDAIYHFLNVSNHQQVDFTIVATGVIRHNIDLGNTGKQNINDIFNIMPLGLTKEKIPGSPLGKIYISGNEIKKVLELILTVYPKMNDYYLYLSGIQLTYNLKKGPFNKISKVCIGSDEKGYQPISFSKKDKTLYCLAANKYILSFLGAIKKMSFGIVNVVAKNRDGSKIQNDNFLIDIDKEKEGIQEAKEWLALLDYIRSFPDINGNGLPDIPAFYTTKVNPITSVK